MPVNMSNLYFSLDTNGNVIEHAERSNPAAVSILAVPGGMVSNEDVLKYKLGDRLKAADPNAIQFDPVGNAIYHDEGSGRAHSVSMLAADDPRRIAGEAAEVEKKKELAAMSAHRGPGKSLLADVNASGVLTGQPRGKPDGAKPIPASNVVPVAGTPTAPAPTVVTNPVPVAAQPVPVAAVPGAPKV